MLNVLFVSLFDLTLSFPLCRLKETRKLRSEMKKTPSTSIKANPQQLLAIDMEEPIQLSENTDASVVNFPSPVVKPLLYTNY